MSERNLRDAIVVGMLVACGLALGGYFIGNSLLRARAADRYVTVKGLAEREVAANLVIWPITFTVTADDLGTLQRRTDESAAKIKEFLADDFEEDEKGYFSITDRDEFSPEFKRVRVVTTVQYFLVSD